MKLNPLTQQFTLLHVSTILYNNQSPLPIPLHPSFHFNPRNFSLLGTFKGTQYNSSNSLNLTLFWNLTLSTSMAETFQQSHVLQISSDHPSPLSITQLAHYILHAILIVLLIASVVVSQRIEVPIDGESLSVGNKYLVRRKRVEVIAAAAAKE